MDTFRNTVTIARPADEVFAFLANLRNIPRWNYAIARTVPTSPGPAGESLDVLASSPWAFGETRPAFTT